MAPLIPAAKITLSYPLYACDFDPTDSSKLVVGGGGGPGRNGVGNKITVLNTSKSEDVAEAGEIELSKEEDSVTCLAVGQHKGKTTMIYAGVNSSPSDVAQGKNEHLRAFGVETTSKPSKSKSKSATSKSVSCKLSPLSKTSFFATGDKDTYQRVVRLSRAFPNQPQLGAVATGFAKEPDIVLFSTPVSASASPNKMGTLQLQKEAVDMDFIQTGANSYDFAYCDEHKIYIKKLAPKTDMEMPKCIYTTPGSDSTEKPTVPAFRALRWLAPGFLLMLTNIHGQGGAVLQILRQTSDADQARVTTSIRLPGDLSKATGLSVCNLTPPLTATAKQEYTQFVIAVAGQDMSIRLFKVDFQVLGDIVLVSPIKSFRTFKKVHPVQITGLAFSTFTPPAHPVKASTPPQYLKLASVSVGQTVVVHTIPLFPVPLSVKRGQSSTPRYVVALPSEKAIFSFGALLSIVVVLLGALLTQSILEIRGGVRPVLGAHNYLPVQWQEAIGKPYVFPTDYAAQLSTPSNVPEASKLLPDWFSDIKKGTDTGVIYLHDQEESVRAHLLGAQSEQEGAKAWEDLAHEQREGWKKKLKDAGHWVEEMGETVFKGVVFGELAGAVGAAVAGG